MSNSIVSFWALQARSLCRPKSEVRPLRRAAQRVGAAATGSPISMACHACCSILEGRTVCKSVCPSLHKMLFGSAAYGVRNASPSRMKNLFLSRHVTHATQAVTPPPPPPSPPPSPAAALVSWVEAGGGSVSPALAVQRAEDGAGFGLAAALDCSSGTQLLSLPPQLYLSYDATTDPRLLALIDQVCVCVGGGRCYGA